MRDKNFKLELETIRAALTDPALSTHTKYACKDLSDSMRDLVNSIDAYLNHKEYTQGDFAGDILTLMEFLASGEVEEYSKGSELQLELLQAALVNYADSLDCLDVAQDD